MSTIERALEKQRKLAEKLRANAAGQAEDNTVFPAAPAPADAENALTTMEQVIERRASLTPTDKQPRQPSLDPASHGDDTSNRCVHIDIERLEARGFITPAETFSKIKEEYRYIKRPLLNNAFGPNAATLTNPNLVMVSSSYSGEGKTFTAINLAISMALEHDRNVLLIDADVIHPHICERLNVEERPGLLDFLRGSIDVNDIIYDTDIPRLKLVSAGTRHHHASEMLASEKMKKLMVELSTRYSDRIVIFDTSPLLGASETNVLSQYAGQAVIVVEEGRTTHQQLEQALRLLNPDMATNLILNKSNAGRSEYYGYYYASS